MSIFQLFQFVCITLYLLSCVDWDGWEGSPSWRTRRRTPRTWSWSCRWTDLGSTYPSPSRPSPARQGCIKFPKTWYFSPPPFFKSWYFRPLPLSPLDILPKSLNIIGKIILLPLTPFSTLYYYPQPWYSLPLFTTWYSSPTDFIKFQPRRGGGKKFIHSCFTSFPFISFPFPPTLLLSSTSFPRRIWKQKTMKTVTVNFITSFPTGWPAKHGSVFFGALLKVTCTVYTCTRAQKRTLDKSLFTKIGPFLTSHILACISKILKIFEHNADWIQIRQQYPSI